jgi:hypothetical protein
MVEAEEQNNYENRMSQKWKDDLQPMVGSLHQDGVITKPYIEDAPYVVAVFAQVMRERALAELVPNCLSIASETRNNRTKT